MNEDLEFNLRENRYEASALELDAVKRRALDQASRGSRARGSRSPRLVTSFLVVALMLTGGSAVVASTSGTSSGGQPSASISQYEQIVLPERVTPGNAQIVAPTGCVAKAFNAKVRGVGILKVTFTLDGKKISVLKKPNSGTNFIYRVNPAKLKLGVHQVRATVIFQPSSQKPAKTFRISFQRCAKKLLAPRFTG